MRCQSCGTPVRRSDYQKTLLSLNEKWIRTNFPQGVDRWATERLHDEETIFRADGDADVVSAPSVARPGGGARYYPMSSATARVSATEEQPSSSTLSISGVDPVESEDFRYAPCTACGGILKPDVVFFGDTVNNRAPFRLLPDLKLLVDQIRQLMHALLSYCGYRTGTI